MAAVATGDDAPTVEFTAPATVIERDRYAGGEVATSDVLLTVNEQPESVHELAHPLSRRGVSGL